MVFRRSITARAKLLYHQQRVAAPFPLIHQDDNDHQNSSRSNTVYKNSLISDHFQRRLFGTCSNLGFSYRSGNLFHDRRFAIPAASAPLFVRNMSSLGEGSPENIEVMTDMANVLSDKAAEVAAQVGPVANEVAIAAADSFMPVAAIQHLIGYVHFYTGFNWWASIVVTTLLVGSIRLPLTINIQKSDAKFRLLKPRLEEIKGYMRNRDMSPAAVARGQQQMKELYKEYGVTPFTRFKGLLINGLIFFCFLEAVSNMAKNVPSFKVGGGSFWFTDLSTPDSTYILPILMASVMCTIMECDPLERNPRGRDMKNGFQVFTVLTIPLYAMLTKATLCYWITNSLFGLAIRLVLKKPVVKLFLGFPIIPVTPPSPDKKPGLSFFETLKKYAAAQQNNSLPLSSNPANKKRSAAPTLRQKIRNLENEAKERKKEKEKL